MFEVLPCGLPGCHIIKFQKRADKRGAFIKTFSAAEAGVPGMSMNLREEYFTFSGKGVFRGLHFQLPPYALDKLVYCVQGQVTDYLVDLRQGSPDFGKWFALELSGEEPCAVFAPVGIAHGFYVRSESALMQYKVSEIYAPEYDAGVDFRSFSFADELHDPIVSERDLAFPVLSDFKSPFTFSE